MQQQVLNRFSSARASARTFHSVSNVVWNATTNGVVNSSGAPWFRTQTPTATTTILRSNNCLTMAPLPSSTADSRSACPCGPLAMRTISTHTTNTFSPFSPSSETGPIDDDYESAKFLTHQLLDCTKPTDAMDLDDINLLLQYWIHRSDPSLPVPTLKSRDEDLLARNEAISYCFQILDYLSDQLLTADPSNKMITGTSFDQDSSFFDTGLLNEILSMWFRNVIQRQKIRKDKCYQIPECKKFDRLTPSAVAAKIENYRWSSLVQPNILSYQFIVKVASSYRRHPNEGILFADSLVENLIRVSSNIREQEARSQDTTHDNGTDIAGIDTSQKSSPNYHPQSLLVDYHTIGSIIKGWIDSGHPDSQSKAQKWLDRSVRLSDRGWQGMRPNAYYYGLVIHGWSKVGRVDRAQRVFEFQLEDYLHHHNESARPQRISINSVLTAWSRSNRPDAPEQSESILRRMIQLFKTDSRLESSDRSNRKWKDCDPDMYTWNNVLSCFAKRAKENAEYARRAEQLLIEMLHDTSLLSSSAQSWTIAFNTVLHANAQAGHPERVQYLLAQLLLDETHHHSVDTEPLVRQLQQNLLRPDGQSFNIALAAWCRADHVSDAPQRAEALFAKMRHLSQEFHPTIVSYGSVMQCWAQVAKSAAGQNDQARAMAAAEQTERWYRDLHEEYLAGAVELKPNFVSFKIVLNAWFFAAQTKTGTRELWETAASRIEAFLDEILGQWQERQEHVQEYGEANPNKALFRIVLQAIDAARVGDKARRAARIQELMMKHGIEPGYAESKLLKRLSKKKQRNMNSRSQKPSGGYD